MVKIIEKKTGKIISMQDRFAKTLVKIGKHEYVGGSEPEPQAVPTIAELKTKEHFSVQPEMVGAEARVMTPESKVEHSVGAMLSNRELVPGTGEQPAEQPGEVSEQVGAEDEAATEHTGRRRKRNYSRRDMAAEET